MAKQDAQAREMARRTFWKVKKWAKTVGTIDQFDADCARRWVAAKYESEPVIKAVVRAYGEKGERSEIGSDEEVEDVSDWLIDD